jgi:glycosyltransferase involved in cell wall biosynthesis
VAEPPRVSVLMTVYNAAPYLREAIDSVLHQTFGDWELIVIENGSTDVSPDIVRSYADSRIRVVPLLENIGRTPALREAFGMARGEYLAVLDADDRSLRDRLSAQVAYLDAHPDVVLVGTWARHIDEKGDVVGDWRTPTEAPALTAWFAWGNPFVHSSVMYRRAAAEEVGGYPADLPYAQDLGLWLRLADRGRLAVIDNYLCERRVSSKSLTRRRDFRLDVVRDILATLAYARAHLVLGKEGLRRNREETFITKVKLGVAMMRGGRIPGGCRVLAGAIVENPIGLFRNRVFQKRG